MGACTSQSQQRTARRASPGQPSQPGPGNAGFSWPSTPARAAACCASEAADDDDGASDHRQGAPPWPPRPQPSSRRACRRGQHVYEMQSRTAQRIERAGVDGVEWTSTAMHATHQSGRLVCSSVATAAAMDPRCGRAQPMQRMA
ncbi:hypothetical protein COCC4DRAFT_61397 [Bipolaris maydis ATCC 48331]|uniref:Uncharacterized protein n=2 Tax=Cochliobolus heterostrophus TaxID=5016 RepID=M2UYK8_COCH5|nr:uncharacterized protein COCC4DRAFT_61397 [Bipolaris maydis ATCC 48331]EMD92827.1 hypothetical protein COCHEDRAFT_1029087 [Bipolaris maydis C5]ENI04784.1 hypothetical protein COCC4DRAFT_61397 [Bipolaris maydis ATCC 48331]KAH7558907.1 hypothetical protein BM1_05044 [Bipolaris maydis]